MKEQFQREALVIGQNAVEKLSNSSVILFGLGGVGSFTAEALIRAGVGKLSVVDFDTVDITNINRQLIATHQTIGRDKTELVKERALAINPDIKITTYKEKFFMENSDLFFKNKHYDYVIDAIDTVTSKLDLIEIAKNNSIPVISSMGTGNKLNPMMFEIADISKTSVCPLAKVMRRELKNRRINKVKVLYSKEIPNKPKNNNDSREKQVNVGSISFVPSVAGLIIASEVVKDIISK